MIVEYNIKNEQEILIEGKGNYCLKLKKGMLKTKKLLKITSYIRWTRAWSWGNMYLPKHGKWWTLHLYLKINSGFYAKECQVTKSKKQKVHLCLRPCSLDNTLNRPLSSAWESFNIRQKLGLFCLFVLRVSHISNLPILSIRICGIQRLC